MSQKLKNKKIIVRVVVFSIITYVLLQGFLWVISNKFAISAYCSDVYSFIDVNQPTLETLMSDSFDVAVECANDSCRSYQINLAMSSLIESESLSFYETSYFIRLNTDGNIEKWFWSGEVKTTIPITNGERKVVKLLNGKSPAICTQNWKLDGGPTYMTYLKDGFSSEAETIIPIKSNGKVIGAFVSRWGD